MNPDDWTRLGDVFERALDLPEAARPAFLDEACGGDAELRREAESLLGSDSDAGEFLEKPAFDLLLVPGRRVGRYELGRVLASGGMGTVYEATQDEPRRRVALKMIRPGTSSPQAMRRFRFEAEVLGRLRHPAIAQVYEFGVHRENGRDHPYFAMELVEGARDILSHARAERLSVKERLELFILVCNAVHYGHQRGVIHRDLKPGNVLVDASGSPKVIDFGVARLVEEEGGALPARTQTGQIVGTLQYMSPEQLRTGGADVDTRSDVYALGCLLHELLTGRLPHAVDDRPLHELIRMLEVEEPPPASELPSELAWILGKSLAKRADRRYASASELAADLERYTRHEPVLAGPPSAVYVLRKLVRRHRVAVGAAAAVLLALAVGLMQARREARAATRALGLAEREALKSEGVSDFLRRMLTSVGPLARGEETRVVDMLDEAAQTLDLYLPDDAEARALVRNVMGETYSELRRFDRAAEHLGAAMSYAVEELAPDDPLRLDVVTNHARLLILTQRIFEAEELLRGAETLAVARLGPDHRITLRIRSTLAELLLMIGRLEEAEQRYDEHIAALEGDPLADEGEHIASLGGRALVWRKAGRVEEAREELERVLETALEVLPEDHFRVWNARYNVAGTYLLLGRLEESERMLRDLLELVRARFGDRHAFVVQTLSELARCVAARGRAGESLELSKEAQEVSEEVYGEKAPRTLWMRAAVAEATLSLGRAEDAEEVSRAGLAHCGDEEREYEYPALRLRLVLASSLIAQDRREEGAEVLSRALELARTSGTAELVENLRARLRSLGVETP